VQQWWSELPYRECFLLNKLLTGALRVGVSELLVTRALAEVTGLPRARLTQRLMGDWTPCARFWDALTAAEDASAAPAPATPYPFYLAAPLESPVESLGPVHEWIAEWKWDGIRAQVVRRAGESFVWSRGEELVTESFPEIAEAAAGLPDGTVLDGELLAGGFGQALPFAQLQRRLGRKRVGSALRSAVPVHFRAYDLLEEGGVDLRAMQLAQRRARLEAAIAAAANPIIGISTRLAADDWPSLAAQREQARALGVEGLMLKRLAAPYGTGRHRGAWWKWKIEPRSFDGVLLYAQPGHGRRSNLYTDYTFAAWNGAELVPVAKAYSGLDDAEIAQLDRWIRAHTREKFGPVRSVEPLLVFEIAFEGIARSARHKSGVALRFPRIARWRHDKPAAEADQLTTLLALIDSAPAASRP
jgi:DNA ligase-1